MQRLALFATSFTALVALAACNPDSAPTPPHDAATAPAPPPASAPWDYATPQGTGPSADQAAAENAEHPPGLIPVPFRAVWAIEEVDCTNEPGLTRIAIAPDSISFYEGRSQVLSASSGADGRLNLEVEHVAEGMTEGQRQTLHLAGDAQSLVYTRGDHTFSYRRCPG